MRTCQYYTEINNGVSLVLNQDQELSVRSQFMCKLVGNEQDKGSLLI